MENNDLKLEKKLTPLNVWALAFGCIIGWGAFVMPGNTFLPIAGPLGTAIAMVIASLAMILIAFNYDYMINKYPFAGGEFTYTKKAFGDIHGFVCAWFLGLSYLTIVPLNATALALIGRNLMANFFQFGVHYVVAGYDIYFGELLLAIVTLVVFAWLSIRGVRFTGVFQTMLALALVGGVVIFVFAALFNENVTFSGIYPLYNSNASKMGGILAVVAIAPWAFIGFDTIPQAAEEFKFSSAKVKIIMVISILFGGAVYIALNTVTALVVPQQYANWLEYIADLKNLNGLISLPTFNAAYILLGNVGLLFLGVSVLAAVLSGIVGFYMATSRLLYSLGNSGIIAPWFGKLHSQYKTPMNAIIFVLSISLIGPFLGRTALSWIVDMSSIGAAVGYAYTSAAAFKFAKIDDNISIMSTGLLGTLLGVLFIVLLLVPIPAFNCSLGFESLVCLGLWIMLGFLFKTKR